MLDEVHPADEDGEDAENEAADDRDGEGERQQEPARDLAVEPPRKQPPRSATVFQRLADCSRHRVAWPSGRRACARVRATGEKREQPGYEGGDQVDSEGHRWETGEGRQEFRLSELTLRQSSERTSRRRSSVATEPNPHEMTTDSLTTPDQSAARVHRDRARKRSALDFPVLDKKPGLLGRRLAVLPGDGHPVWTYVLGILFAFVLVASLSIVAGLVATRSAAPHSRSRSRRRELRPLPRPAPLGRSDRRVAHRVDHGRRRRLADRRRRRCRDRRFREALAARRLLALRADCRGGFLPRHDAPDPPSPAAGPPTRGTARERELSLRAHRRFDCRLLRARAALDLADEESCGTASDLVRRHRDPGLRRFLPHVSRDAPSDRHRRRRDRSGSPRCPRSCSSRARPGARRSDQGRRGRTRRQIFRRRPDGAPARTRASGSRRSDLGRSAEEPPRTEAGEARARGGRRSALRLGRRRNRPALDRRDGAARRRRSRSCRPALPIFSRRTSASRRTSSRRS